MAQQVLEGQPHLRADRFIAVGNGRKDFEVAVHEVVVMVMEGLLAGGEYVNCGLLELLDVERVVHAYDAAEQVEPLLVVIVRDGHCEEIGGEIGLD